MNRQDYINLTDEEVFEYINEIEGKLKGKNTLNDNLRVDPYLCYGVCEDCSIRKICRTNNPV